MVEPTTVVENVGAESVVLCAWPVPDKETRVTPVPSWVRASVPERAPAALGVNETWTVQVAFGARVVQLLDCAKSGAPVAMPTPVNVREPLPELVTVTD